MPTLRGIAVSIHSHFDQSVHPEFPHQDGTWNNEQPVDYGIDVSATERDGAFASVYIPSMSAERFFVKYTIQPPHPPGLYIYFRLLMNGRHIASWGISKYCRLSCDHITDRHLDPRTKPRGQVTRALFQGEVGELYEEHGETFSRPSTESRSLMFAHQETQELPADHGGLIEVQTFRSSGKRRRNAGAECFKEQERYGLLFPSSGFISSPAEDAKFYDWKLIDPKDSPFARFRFHYRTWSGLQSLRIVPRSQKKALLPVSPSFGQLAEYISKAYKGLPILEDEEQMQHSDSQRCMSIVIDSIDQSRRKLPGILKQVRNSKTQESLDITPPKVSLFETTERMSPLRTVKSFRNLPTSIFNSATKTGLREWTRDRPLPLPPVTGRPTSMHSRNSSEASTASLEAHSITPSLQSWVEKGGSSRNQSPEPQLEQATRIKLEPFNDAWNEVFNDEPISHNTMTNKEVEDSSLICHHVTNQLRHSSVTPPPEGRFLSRGLSLAAFNEHLDFEIDNSSCFSQERGLLAGSGEFNSERQDQFGRCTPSEFIMETPKHTNGRGYGNHPGEQIVEQQTNRVEHLAKSISPQNADYTPTKNKQRS